MHLKKLMIVLLWVLASREAVADCDTPSPGLWLIQAYEPPINFNSPSLSGYLKLTLSSENPNVFVGESMVIPSIASFAMFTFELTGIFDVDSCSLYGAYICQTTMVHDTFQWTNYGNGTMAGLYQPMMNARPQFPKHGMHTLQYQGPI
eukprot:g7355.t1